MRKILIISIIISCITLLQSCDDFLDIKPRNTKVVKTVKDYRDILASYMNWLKDINGKQFNIMGIGVFGYPKFDMTELISYYSGELQLKEENLIDPTSGNIRVYEESLLNWDQTNIRVWERNYAFLGPLNFIIDNIDKADVNEEEALVDIKNYVKGEALVWRAFAFYKLLQYYSPYKSSDLGIPLSLSAYKDPVNATLKRNTQKEVYDQIVLDCKEALKLLKETPKDIWNAAYDEKFINAMLANVYMYKAMSGAAENDDWNMAVLHADKAMIGRSLATDPAGLKEIFDLSDDTGYQEIKNDETFLRIVKKNFFTFGRVYARSDASFEVYAGYSSDDIRKGIYFTGSGTSAINSKYDITPTVINMLSGRGGVFNLFRLADMYLIKAEALVRDNKDALAIEVLNEFKQSRYTEDFVIPTNHDALLNEILKERRLEFYLENDKRWIDMKRLGVEFDRGTIIGKNYLLKSDDFRYTFPIPITEFVEESDIVQNPGWEHLLN
ncbi:MAG: RagB/SusD family nutrient uptake outer membrane protein [Marinifilum sp.]|jgi:hypothetical protein|nr:RagB/SusD family nutrient uptake outer membrane protein [Marinifilum sp.]